MQIRPDPAQLPRLKGIRVNLLERMKEAKDHGWLGEVAAIEASLAAADRKLDVMNAIAARHTVTHLGMSDFRATTGRSTSQT
ncbi:hypothetical protein [Phytohabitans suffuscus]|uniref:Uncharacterized protein n=1 Tax=Phytohabitans suffuscus TaxID=624315 RepID=A0A6F8YF92_9ACTN|nr:hypothetical protein [Phytohabitans suffuscus]BCB84795.1 hypothetical protein Psuf_021080 [Phytohabitans suffuscus]